MGNVKMGVLKPFIVPLRDGSRHFRAPLIKVIPAVHQREAGRYGIELPSLDNVSDSAPVMAVVNANRWIAHCPNCTGAEFVFFDTPVFMCLCCFNAAVGGLWRRVQLPSRKQIVEIEMVLLARVNPITRNWTGQSIRALKIENVEHYEPASIQGEP